MGHADNCYNRIAHISVCFWTVKINQKSFLNSTSLKVTVLRLLNWDTKMLLKFCGWHFKAAGDVFSMKHLLQGGL